MSLLNQLAQMSAQNTALSQQFAREQMAFQAHENKIARDWQERMSNTAHQRQVKDLQAAGLNPILSVNSGAATGSASGSTGASGQVDNSSINALASLAAASMNIASNERMQLKQLQNAYDIALLQTQSAESVASGNRKVTPIGFFEDRIKWAKERLDNLSSALDPSAMFRKKSFDRYTGYYRGK